MSAPAAASWTVKGRYAICDPIGSGGMASVHLGRLLGPANFARPVAIKRLHAHLATEPQVVAMFLDEARLAARVRHPNVVSVLDVVTTDGDPFLVMDYVEGESLARLLEEVRGRGEHVPLPVAVSVTLGVLSGLHAAHEATGEGGQPLGIVHRDVSPHNVMIGVDGVARVLDFGVAKAAGRLQTTREGHLKGKLAFTAPELVRGGAVTRAADVYSAAVVFWEMLTGRPLFAGDNEANVLERVLFAVVEPPSRYGRSPAVLDPIVLKALARDPSLRFRSAREMARAIGPAVPSAGASEVGGWVERLAGDALRDRARKVARIEREAFATPGGAAGTFDAGAPVSGDHLIVAEVAVPEARPRRAARAAGTAAMAFVAVGLAGFGVLAARHRPSMPAANPAPVASPAVVRASASPSEAPPPAVAPMPSAADLAIPRPPAPSSPPAPVRIARPARAPAPAKAPVAPKSKCDPPWVVDSQGIKQYKLDCL